MKILLSKSSLKDHYSAWLTMLDPHIGLVDASSTRPEKMEALFHDCLGILLTGGSDINPERMDLKNPLSGSLGRAFLDAVRRQHIHTRYR